MGLAAFTASTHTGQVPGCPVPVSALTSGRLPILSAYVDSQRSCQHMLTPMDPVLQLAEGAAGNDPDVGLRAVAALRALAERLEILQVDNARELGWSWQQIAGRLGVTRQTVHRKHGKRTGRR
jgi:Homeodomain-like domain